MAITSITKAKVYTFLADPSHGWLSVHEDDLKAVGLETQDFSSYSYQHLHNLYLEEDCDAPLFISAFIRHFGHEPNIDEVHTSKDCIVRRFRRLNNN